MADDWILDVLKDLRVFAQRNGFEGLSEHLEQTLDVARQELATRAELDRAAGAELLAKNLRRH